MANLPAIEQVPAEFNESAKPWQSTVPFPEGKRPSSIRATRAELIALAAWMPKRPAGTSGFQTGLSTKARLIY